MSEVRAECSPRFLAAGSYGSPAALVRTTVHVQDLPGNVAGLGQVNDGFHDVADAGDCTHRFKVLTLVRRLESVLFSLVMRSRRFFQYVLAISGSRFGSSCVGVYRS